MRAFLLYRVGKAHLGEYPQRIVRCDLLEFVQHGFFWTIWQRIDDLHACCSDTSRFGRFGRIFSCREVELAVVGKGSPIADQMEYDVIEKDINAMEIVQGLLKIK